jgi:aminoglycoside N3'-acetyltransferase
MSTKEEIAKQLRKLGLQNYSAVMLYTSMRKIGKVESGADALIDLCFRHLEP